MSESIDNQTNENEEIVVEETFPWEEVRNFDEEIYLGYWEDKAIVINVYFGSCFLQDFLLNHPLKLV